MKGITPFTVINDLKKLLDDKGIKNEVVRKKQPQMKKAREEE